MTCRAVIMIIGFGLCLSPLPAMAVEPAPQADYFIPSPEQAPFPNEFEADPPQVVYQDFYPQPETVPEAQQTSPAQIADNAVEFYPQPATVPYPEIAPQPTIAPYANEFIPQAAIAPPAQEFLP